MQDSLDFQFVELINSIDEDFLISISNRGVFKRAIKEYEGSMYTLSKIGRSIIVEGPEFKVELTINPMQFKCTCPSRSICKHVIIGYLYLCEKKKEIFGELINDSIRIKEEINNNKKKVKKDVKSNNEELYLESIKALRFCKDTVYEIFKIGLARCQQGIVNDLEQSALFCKGGNLISLEKKIRIVAEELKYFLEKSNNFNSNSYVKTLSRIVLEIKELECKNKGEYITFISMIRNVYDKKVDGSFISVGGEYFSTKSGYDGVTVFFYSKDLKEIFTITNSRPNIYSRNLSRKDLWQTIAPWSIGGSYRTLLSQEISLKNINSSSENRLTTSKDVITTSISKVKGTDVLSTIDFIKDFKSIVWSFEKVIFNFIKVNRFGELSEDSINGMMVLDLYDVNNNKLTMNIKLNEHTQNGIEKIKRYYKHGLSEYIFAKCIHDDYEKRVIPISLFDSGSIINIFE